MNKNMIILLAFLLIGFNQVAGKPESSKNGAGTSNPKIEKAFISFHKINLWIREPQNGKIALSFTNSSFDTAKNVTLMLHTDNKAIKLYDMECRETVIPSSASDGSYQKFVIPSVDSWQTRLVICE